MENDAVYRDVYLSNEYGAVFKGIDWMGHGMKVLKTQQNRYLILDLALWSSPFEYQNEQVTEWKNEWNTFTFQETYIHMVAMTCSDM